MINPKTKIAFEIVGTLILVVIAILLARYDDIKGGFFLESINFKTTQGRIISSDINYHIGANSAPGYRFKVKYEFKVEQKKYISNSVNFGSKVLKDKHRAEEVIRKYPVGKEVIVYYEKDNPGFSTLEPNKNDNNQFILTFTFFSLLILVVIAILYYRLRSPQKENKKIKIRKKR
ncbi:MAG: DUF3592 domain-containing protein [Alteromonadaceae bacterium]|nr:DUF3592 domain-containing protein [Alteromonadaceae bacterium]